MENRFSFGNCVSACKHWRNYIYIVVPVGGCFSEWVRQRHGRGRNRRQERRRWLRHCRADLLLRRRGQQSAATFDPSGQLARRENTETGQCGLLLGWWWMAEEHDGGRRRKQVGERIRASWFKTKHNRRGQQKKKTYRDDGIISFYVYLFLLHTVTLI